MLGIDVQKGIRKIYCPQKLIGKKGEREKRERIKETAIEREIEIDRNDRDRTRAR